MQSMMTVELPVSCMVFSCGDFVCSFLIFGGWIVLLIPLLIASIAVLAVLVLLFIYLLLSERKSYIYVWFFSLVSLMIAYVSRIYMVVKASQGFFPVWMNYTSTVVGMYLVCKGIRMFFAKERGWMAEAAGILLVSVYTFLSILGFDTDAVLLASAVYYAAMLISSGIMSLCAQDPKGLIRNVLAYSLFFWGASIIMYPLCRIFNIIPIEYGYLFVGISGLVTVLSLQTAYLRSVGQNLKAKEDRIRILAIHDRLTGVYNRAFFEEITDTFFSKFELPAVIAMCDVNALKLINDTFGHKQGDELLINAVKIIKESVNEDDVIIRWGGDEFIIIMPHTTMNEAIETVRKIKAGCGSLHHKTIPMDISIGISEIINDSCLINTAIEKAEDGMYTNKLLESRRARRAIIEFLEKLLWEKDYQTEEHVLRLREMIVNMGRHIGLSDKETDELTQVALLHDIGKIGVPVEILNKPGALTDDEWEIMKKHCEIGYRITQSSVELANISEAILGHHEWWNGKGYPQGLIGEEIPLYSRIVAIVDSYDVITHDRPYKKAVSPHEALKEIKRCAGKQYDPYLANAFVEMMSKNLGLSPDSEMFEKEMKASKSFSKALAE